MKLNYENIDEHGIEYSTEFGFNGVVGVIRDDDAVVGFYDIDVSGDTINLQELEILEECRGMGYGIQFIETLFNKYPECEFITGVSLEDSVSFYANLPDVEWSTTCDTCECSECCMSLTGDKQSYEMDICDDYSENVFKLTRASLL